MKLFISYAHVDRAIVSEWLVKKLRAGHHEVWIDESLTVGREWKPQLVDAIHDSDALVYAITPESISSEVCQWEVRTAIDLGKPIVPVLMQARTEIPDWLGKVQYVDFSEGATGDAVAKLIGGLQQIPPSQVPPSTNKFSSINPQNPPPQTVQPEEKTQQNIMIKLLSHPAFQAIIGIIGLVIAIVALIQPGGNPDPTPTSSVAQSTPATPIVVALRDLDIRSGPGAGFSRLNILPVEGSLDILGISEDRLWYHVLLRDGTRGWILAAESGAKLNGDRSVVQVIIPTVTPSNTPTDTLTPTNTSTPTDTLTPTAIDTATPTNTPTPTATDIPSPTPTFTNTVPFGPSPTSVILPSTPVSSPTATNTVASVIRSYPCEGTIIESNATTLNVVRARASSSAPLVRPVTPNEKVTILAESTASGGTWYQITYGTVESSGWIPQDYIIPSQSCP